MCVYKECTGVFCLFVCVFVCIRAFSDKELSIDLESVSNDQV